MAFEVRRRATVGLRSPCCPPVRRRCSHDAGSAIISGSFIFLGGLSTPLNILWGTMRVLAVDHVADLARKTHESEHFDLESYACNLGGQSQ